MGKRARKTLELRRLGGCISIIGRSQVLCGNKDSAAGEPLPEPARMCLACAIPHTAPQFATRLSPARGDAMLSRGRRPGCQPKMPLSPVRGGANPRVPAGRIPPLHRIPLGGPGVAPDGTRDSLGQTPGLRMWLACARPQASRGWGSVGQTFWQRLCRGLSAQSGVRRQARTSRAGMSAPHWGAETRRTPNTYSKRPQLADSRSGRSWRPRERERLGAACPRPRSQMTESVHEAG